MIKFERLKNKKGEIKKNNFITYKKTVIKRMMIIFKLLKNKKDKTKKYICNFIAC